MPGAGAKGGSDEKSTFVRPSRQITEVTTRMDIFCLPDRHGGKYGATKITKEVPKGL